jgi:hypothetical protein
MKIKKEYSLRYELDDIVIVKREPDGTEREVSPLSQSAAMAWEGIEKGVSREAIIQGIAQEFDGADEAVVAQDLDALMAQLVALGYAEE